MDKVRCCFAIFHAHATAPTMAFPLLGSVA